MRHCEQWNKSGLGSIIIFDKGDHPLEVLLYQRMVGATYENPFKSLRKLKTVEITY